MTYDALLTLKSVVLSELQDLKIKKNSIVGEVGVKLSRLLLAVFARQRFELKTGVGSDTRMLLLQTVEVLAEPLKLAQSQGVLPWGVRKSDVD